MYFFFVCVQMNLAELSYGLKSLRNCGRNLDATFYDLFVLKSSVQCNLKKRDVTKPLNLHLDLKILALHLQLKSFLFQDYAVSSFVLWFNTAHSFIFEQAVL